MAKPYYDWRFLLTIAAPRPRSKSVADPCDSLGVVARGLWLEKTWIPAFAGMTKESVAKKLRVFRVSVVS